MFKDKILMWEIIVLILLIGISVWVIGENIDTKLLNSRADDALEDCYSRSNRDLVNKCVTELGISFMDWTALEVDRSIELCDQIDHRDALYLNRSCIEGVFISFYLNLSREDSELFIDNVLDIDMLSDFCFQYSGITRDICMSESFPLLENRMLDQGGVFDFCSRLSDEGVEYFCYETLYMLAAQEYALDRDSGLDKFVDYCLEAQELYRDSCLNSGILKLLQTDISLLDDAMEICRLGVERLEGYNCGVAVSIYFPEFYFEGDEIGRLKYCNSLPEGLNALCLESRSLDMEGAF